MFNFKDFLGFMAVNDAFNDAEQEELEEEHEEERKQWEQECGELESKHQQEREEWEKMLWGKDNFDPYSDEEDEDENEEDDMEEDDEYLDDDLDDEWGKDDEEDNGMSEETWNVLPAMSDVHAKDKDTILINGKPATISYDSPGMLYYVPKSVCDEKLLTILKDSKPILRFRLDDNDIIKADYRSTQEFYDEKLKSLSSIVTLMEFSNDDLAEDCQREEDNTQWGYVDRFYENYKKSWNIDLYLIHVKELKNSNTFPIIGSTQKESNPLDEYIAAGGIKGYSAKESVADKEEKEEKKGKSLTALLLGFSYHCDEDYLEQIQKGDVFVLVPEPENEVDPCAIAAYRKGQKRAYVMKADARRLADIIKVPTECYVVKVAESSVRVKIEV